MADKSASHPARADLAAAHLKGAVDAPRYAEGKKFSIVRAAAPRCACARATTPAQDSELLFGEDLHRL